MRFKNLIVATTFISVILSSANSFAAKAKRPLKPQVKKCWTGILVRAAQQSADLANASFQNHTTNELKDSLTQKLTKFEAVVLIIYSDVSTSRTAEKIRDSELGAWAITNDHGNEKEKINFTSQEQVHEQTEPFRSLVYKINVYSESSARMTSFLKNSRIIWAGTVSQDALTPEVLKNYLAKK